jgi:hypothetical protein
MHIQAETPNAGFTGGQIPDVLEQSPENSLLAEFRPNVNTLQPPDGSIAPVAPFIGYHYLTDDGVFRFTNEVAALGWIA